MSDILTLQILETMGTRHAVLGMGSYSLLVRFRVRGLFIECSVPTWSGLKDLLENIEEVTLVVVKESDKNLSWVFARGKGKIIDNHDWESLVPPKRGLVEPEDLYYLLRIEMKRIEVFDEQRGWGFREITDILTSL